MKRTAMQRVVNCICVESDYYYEWIKHGEVEWIKPLKDLMDFLTEAAKKGLNVDNGIYKYTDKLRVIKQCALEE